MYIAMLLYKIHYFILLQSYLYSTMHVFPLVYVFPLFSYIYSDEVCSRILSRFLFLSFSHWLSMCLNSSLSLWLSMYIYLSIYLSLLHPDVCHCSTLWERNFPEISFTSTPLYTTIHTTNARSVHTPHIVGVSPISRSPNFSAFLLTLCSIVSRFYSTHRGMPTTPPCSISRTRTKRQQQQQQEEVCIAKVEGPHHGPHERPRTWYTRCFRGIGQYLRTDE